MSDSRDTLLAAADYLIQNGHCKGQLYSYKGKGYNEEPQACALGALRAVTDGLTGGALISTSDSPYRKAAELLTRHLQSTGEIPTWEWMPDPTALIPRWNDHPERSAEDVVLAFKRAAEEAS